MSDTNQLVKVSGLPATKDAQKTCDLEKKNKDALWEFFTGPEHDKLYIPLADFLISYGIKLKVGDNGIPFDAQDYSVQFRRVAVELYPMSEEIVCHKSHGGLLLWEMEFLYDWIDEVKNRMRAEIEKKQYGWD